MFIILFINNIIYKSLFIFIYNFYSLFLIKYCIFKISAIFTNKLIFNYNLIFFNKC